MKVKICIAAIVVQLYACAAAYGQINMDLKALQDERKSLQATVQSLSDMQKESLRDFENLAGRQNNDNYISRTLFLFDFIDKLIQIAPDSSDSLVHGLTAMIERKMPFVTLNDSILTIEEELYRLQQNFNDAQNISRFQELLVKRRKFIDEFDQYDMETKNIIAGEMNRLREDIKLRLEQDRKRLHVIDKKIRLCNIVNNMKHIEPRNAKNILSQFYTFCRENDQEQDSSFVPLLLKADGILLENYKNFIDSLGVYSLDDALIDLHETGNDIQNLQLIQISSPDSIRHWITNQANSRGRRAIWQSIDLQNTIPIVKTRTAGGSKDNSYFIRSNAVTKDEYLLSLAAHGDVSGIRQFRSVPDRKSSDYMQMVHWLGADVVTSADLDKIEKLHHYKYMTDAYDSLLNTINPKGALIKISASQLPDAAGGNAKSILKKYWKSLHPRRVILKIDGGILADRFVFEQNGNRTAHWGYGNYNYGILIGYRYHFDSQGIRQGSDMNANFVGLKYSSFQLMPGRTYDSINENTIDITDMKIKSNPTDIHWSAQEVSLVGQFRRFYVGIGMGFGDFQGRLQTEGQSSKSTETLEIDEKIEYGVLTLGLSLPISYFTFDFYGRAYSQTGAFAAESFSIGVNAAVQLFFLRY